MALNDAERLQVMRIAADVVAAAGPKPTTGSVLAQTVQAVYQAMLAEIEGPSRRS